MGRIDPFCVIIAANRGQKGGVEVKVFISLDMEGVAGSFNWKQEGTSDRALVRKWMDQQMRWVIEGIQTSSLHSKIDEILIADSHDGGDNLSYEITAIDDRLHLISGGPRANYMMAGLDSTYDIALLVGYHSGVGKLHGNMDHTYTNSRFHNIWINGRPMNEALINAAYASYFSTPVGLVIGDAALKEELHQPEAMPWVRYVTTKYALSRYAVKNRPMEVVRRETVQAVKATLSKEPFDIPMFQFAPPIQLRVEYQNTAMCDVASLIPYTKRIDGRTLEFEHDDYRVVFNTILVFSGMAYTTQ